MNRNAFSRSWYEVGALIFTIIHISRAREHSHHARPDAWQSSAVSMLTNSTTAKTSEKAELEAKVPTLQADIDRLLQAVLTKESSVLHEQQTIDARKQATERRVLELERVNELLEQILGAKLEMSEGGLFVVQIRRADGDGHGKVNEVHVKLNAETAEVEEVRVRSDAVLL